MRIVHAADLHLDSPLAGLAEYEGAPVGEVRRATRRAFVGLVDFCLEKKVDVLLLAGDLYDGDFRDFSTGLFFVEQVSRLKEAGTRVVWLRGNHDAESRMTRHLRLPDNVFELRTQSPETIVFEDLGAAFHGQGYGERDVTQNLVRAYPPPVSGALNVGLLHTALEGRPGHANYAPATLAELLARGYDYFALGHVHTREVLSTEPYVVFPGNLQGRHIRETGPKGATLIEAPRGKIEAVTPIELDVVRWEHLEIPLNDARNLEDVLDVVERSLSRATERAAGRIVACRVTLSGETEAQAQLAARERLTSELRAISVALGPVYLEKVGVKTRGPVSRALLTARADALADLFRFIEGARGDLEVQEELKSAISSEVSSLPHELVEQELFDWEEVVASASRLLEAKLLAPGDGGEGGG